MSYNGYRNYNEWNQSLWINNDEGLYNQAVRLCRLYTKEQAAEQLLLIVGYETPDGVRWTKSGIRAGLVGL